MYPVLFHLQKLQTMTENKAGIVPAVRQIFAKLCPRQSQEVQSPWLHGPQAPQQGRLSCGEEPFYCQTL